MAQDGSSNPYTELVATLLSFNTQKKIGRAGGQYTQCAFPERYRYLKEKLPEIFKKLKIKDRYCKEFRWWRDKLKARSISLIFASNFPNNPGSAFGHTFLRINLENNKDKKMDLLDYAIGYAASVGQENALVYAYKGLMGGYEGRFSLVPYYMKVNEYSNMEARDIWEYELNINQQEVNKLLGHLWELEATTSFDYYFLDENCSYLILTLLEIAKPKWNISEDYFFYVLPVDTIRRIAKEKDSITDIKFRPSLYKKAKALRGKLDTQQVDIYKKVISGELNPGDVKDTDVLNALATYLFFKKQGHDENKLSKKNQDLYNQVLSKRAKLPQNKKNLEEIKISKSSMPEKGHHSKKVTLKASNSLDGQFEEIGFRTGLHDLLDLDYGFSNYTEASFFTAKFAWYNDHKKLRFNEFKIIDFKSYRPYDPLQFMPSWTAKVTYKRPKDFKCNYCLLPTVEASFGGSYEFIEGGLLSYLTMMGRGEYYSRFVGEFRFGPGVSAGILVKIVESLKFHLNCKIIYDFNKNYKRDIQHEYLAEMSYVINQSFDWRVKWEKYNKISTQLGYFF